MTIKLCLQEAKGEQKNYSERFNNEFCSKISMKIDTSGATDRREEEIMVGSGI